MKSIKFLPNGTLTKSPNYTGPPAPRIFHDAVVVRGPVFIVEQECNPEIEMDADDAISWHWVIYASLSDSDGSPEVPAATLRLIPAQAHTSSDDEHAVEGPNYESSKLWDHKEPYLTIGRLATRKEFRGRKYASVLVEASMKYATEHPQDMVKDEGLAQWQGLVIIHAQIHLERFYGTLGFKADEGLGTWYEDGIEHVGMWRRLKVAE